MGIHRLGFNLYWCKEMEYYWFPKLSVTKQSIVVMWLKVVLIKWRL